MKAKTIDRLTLTRQSTRLLNRNEYPKNEPAQHGDICPKCCTLTTAHCQTPEEARAAWNRRAGAKT